MFEMDHKKVSEEVKACNICHNHLPFGPRPVFQIHPNAKILIAGQAPGKKVHETGIPFDDPSGERLRAWMNIDKDTFYNPEKIAILPMGFCYPGTGKTGDLPPRKECADRWRNELLALMPNIQLTLVIGKYAMDWHFNEQKQKNLTEIVKNWKKYWPNSLPLPHPSPRNNIWLKKNAWFANEILPNLKKQVSLLLDKA